MYNNKLNNKKSKILYYSDCFYFAGCENMLISFFNSQKLKNKFDIVLAYSYSKKYDKGFKEKIKVETHNIPLKYFSINILYSRIKFMKSIVWQKILNGLIKISLIEYLLFVYNIFRLYYLFKKIRPDILHINNGGYPGAYSCLAAVFAAKLNKIDNVILVVNNIITPYNNILRFIDIPIDNYIKKHTSLFLTGSKYAGLKIKELWHLKNEKIINIPNTIIKGIIYEQKESILKKLNIEKDSIVIGCIAALEERKGIKYLISAIKYIENDKNIFNKIKLIIVGDGREKENLEKLANKLNITEKIIFLNNTNKIFDIINILNIFVLPSIDNEDFPFVIIESMSLGKPIIGTNIAGIPEQIENNVNGLLVNPRDEKELSDAIYKLVKNKDIREDMGKKSYERFNMIFSNEIIIDQYIDLYDKLILNNS